MSQQIYDAPAIKCSIDNVNSDQQLITVTSLASASVTPTIRCSWEFNHNW